MSKPKLTYFDAPVSRGEECRLALTLAGVDFEDERLNRDAWLARKPTAPFGTVPIYEEPGMPPIGQSNSILVLIGRRHGLHPADPVLAAQHEDLLSYAEDLRNQVGPTMRISDEVEKKKARENVASNVIPTWAAHVEQHLGTGPFVAGDKIHVVDCKLYMVVRWFKRGVVDHVPATVFDAFPKLVRLHDAVEAHPALRGWFARS